MTNGFFSLVAVVVMLMTMFALTTSASAVYYVYSARGNGRASERKCLAPARSMT